MAYLTTKKNFAALILLFSLSVGVLILPKIKLAFAYIPITMAINKINNKQALSNEQLIDLINSAQKNSALADAHYWQDLSTLLFQLAKQQGLTQTTGLNNLRQAKYSAKQSLQDAPSNPYLWYKLALIDILLHFPNKEVAELLLMSIMTGPYELEYLMPRLNLCLLLFSEFNTDDAKDLLRQQLKTAWRISPNTLKGYVAANPNYLNVMTALLKTHDAPLLADIIKTLK